jgi:hypothetical protein
VAGRSRLVGKEGDIQGETSASKMLPLSGAQRTRGRVHCQALEVFAAYIEGCVWGLSLAVKSFELVPQLGNRCADVTRQQCYVSNCG